jgi:hypothetical protein
VVATGLQNPRGLAFGPDGGLYVAEGGLGGTGSTVGRCTQVPDVGPYAGGFTARISRVDVRSGQRVTQVSGLPSNKTNAASGSFVSGVAGVAFLGHSLYALIGAAGCSHGLAGTVNTVVRVSGGRTTRVVDLSSYLMRHPVKHPNAGDFEPDGTWYSILARGGRLYVVEPNHGEVDVVTTRGTVTRLVDVSATFGHIVPTSLAATGSGFYLGNLSPFGPGLQGRAGVYRVSSTGVITRVALGLTAVTAVAVDGGKVYALEAFTGSGLPAPGTGALVRLNAHGRWDTLIKNLDFPTAMVFAHDGSIYLSNHGFGPNATNGEIDRITL